jgi:hypothetical protein
MGLIKFFLLDMSSREAEKYRESLYENKELMVVETDPGYCAWLIDDAYKKRPPQDTQEVEIYKGYRTLLREVIGAEEPVAPVCRVFPSQEGETVDGDPLGESTGLLKHPLLKNWQIDPAGLLPQVEKLQEIEESRIIVHPMQKKERIESFHQEVTREILSDPEYRNLWKRRIEDAAWVLYQQGQGSESKRMVEVSRYLADPMRDGSAIGLFVELVKKTMEDLLNRKKTEEKEKPSLIIKPPRGSR